MTSKYIETYKCLSKISDLKTAVISTISTKLGKSEVFVKSVWSYRNVISKNRILVGNDYVFYESASKALLPTPINKDVILSSIHNNGSSAYMVRENEKTFLLLLLEGGFSSTLNIEELDLHGKIYTDDTLSSFQWSKDGSRIVYTAEKKRPKPISFFTIDSEEKAKKPDGKGEENRYIDDWGEQMEGQHVGVIAVVDVEKLSLKVLDLPDNFLAGEVCWSLDGTQLYGIAYVKTAYRLGIIYCPIRESIMFSIDMEGNFRQLNCSDGHKCSLNSPRLSPDGKSLAFLRSPSGGPHVRSAQLCVLDLQTEQVAVIIDYVDVSVPDVNENLFYGLYGCSDLARNCWCSDSSRILVTTFGHSESTIVIVDTETKSFRLLPSEYSQRVLDVKQDFVLICRSSLLTPNQLLIGSLSASNVVEFVPLSDNSEIDVQSVGIYRRLCLNVPHPASSKLPVPFLYLGPTKCDGGEKKRPLIALLHGGPHSVALNSFSFGVLFFLRLGYSFVIPNYRGSLGQGRESIESLLGYCGTADVTDVHACIQRCLAEFGDCIDRERINMLGGSHGGFLVTHMAAQYPELVHRIVSRNPAIGLSSMQVTSDIPDWVFTETGIEYELGKTANPKELGKMFDMSPLALVDSVKAPIMLQLGKNDRRVPYLQGLNYHKALLARGVKTEAFVYDDCHPLSKVDVEADCLIHVARWFAAVE